MCGTSRDGLDMADVIFHNQAGQWTFELVGYKTVDIPEPLITSLDNAFELSALDLMRLDVAFALFCASSIRNFIKDSDAVDFIASHGATVFHDPSQGLTTQLGSGAVIASQTQLTTVCDFRQQDVSKGGQGAPLVPFADAILFSDCDFTLNLGGFANLTVLDGDFTFGFDLGPCNLALNHLAAKAGLRYDEGGRLAESGRLEEPLLEKLNALPYYAQSPPKSQGVEWLEASFLPLIEKSDASVPDLLRTVTEHIAIQIAAHLDKAGKRCLVTGGGAHNTFLADRIRTHAACELVLPSKQIIDYKEAIAFAFLGLCRLLEMTNILRSVTGAHSDSIAGAVYLP